MTDWIVPANPNEYDARAAFANLQRLHWNLGKIKSIEVNDRVFIYESKTTQRLILCAKVIKPYVTANHIDDHKYFLSDRDFSELAPWMELEFEFEINNGLTLSEMRSLGLKGNIQGIRKMPAEISLYTNRNHGANEENADLITVFKDGKKTKSYITKYERNSKNREAAIRIHGWNCQACGFNFFKKYGSLGKKFIEVHHIKPLHTLENSVKINPETDLAVLCSNCHKMIHRKIEGRESILSVDELKKIVNRKY